MNVSAALQAQGAAVTNALPRRGFTVEEVERMVACGVLREDERLELIRGELIPMAAKGLRHEVLKRALLRQWAPLIPLGLEPLVETTLRLSDDAYVEPDILLVSTATPLGGLSANQCLLAVEIADDPIGFDLGVKPPLYAAAGLPELWVIDARRLVTTVFRRDGESWGTTSRMNARRRLVPGLAPAAAVMLSQLALL